VTIHQVAIILVGALSRWVNHLDDEELSKPHTKVLLKALRKFFFTEKRLLSD
jgi:hypothetical protein